METNGDDGWGVPGAIVVRYGAALDYVIVAIAHRYTARDAVPSTARGRDPTGTSGTGTGTGPGTGTPAPWRVCVFRR